MFNINIGTNNTIITGHNNIVNPNQDKPLKNIKFNCFKAISCFKGRTEILNQIKEYFESNQIVVIYGAPGIGKPETARKFSANNLNEYEGNIIWIFSETPENLQKCFKDLSEILDIKITDKDDVNVSLVYSKFDQSRALFIFDNAESMTTISKYLPCSELHSTVRVLITSQVAPSDSSVGKVPLKALNMTDALQILEDKLGDKFPQHPIKIWEDLVKYLEGIPLSMQVVSSLINKELSKPVRLTKFNLYGFICSLKKNFINSKIPDSEINNYNKTVFNSICFALKRLENECTGVSLELLRFIAYLDADRIYHPLLLSAPLINKSEERLEDALNKLEEYSLIEVEVDEANFKVKVHRTIQLVSRKFDLNERNGTMLKSLMMTLVLDEQDDDTCRTFTWYHIYSILEYVKEDEYKNKLLEFYDENKALAGSYFYALIRFHCSEVLHELLPKFKDEFMETDNYKKKLNDMLLIAIRIVYNKLDIIDLLIEYGAKIDLTPNTFNGFHYASYWLSVELFDRLLISNEPEEMISSRYQWGLAILHILVDQHNEENSAKTMECLDHLIYKWNADISIRDKYGLTILHTACKNWHISVEFIKFLVEKPKCKNLVNTQCDEGKTPLQYIFKNYRYVPNNSEWKQNIVEIVSYFITECGADISIQDNNKWNSLFYVCRYGNAGMIAFVLKTRDCCDLINIQDYSGEVAFTHLLQNEIITEAEIIKLMKLFIVNKMDFNVINKNKKTLVEIAEQKEFKKLSTGIKKHLKKRNLKTNSSTEIGERANSLFPEKRRKLKK